MPFVNGQVANPNGRPKGSRGKKTIFMEKLEAAGIVDATVAALCAGIAEGDPTCLALIVNRIEPALKAVAHRVQFQLDVNAPLADQAKSIRLVVANGELDVDAGKTLLDMIVAELGFADIDAFRKERAKLYPAGVKNTGAIDSTKEP